jgi:GNAT superfamily N-acetyltransferase
MTTAHHRHPHGTSATVSLRAATAADVPALNALIAESARSLSRGFYSDTQIEAAIRYVYGVDSRLIEDGTYYAALDGDRIVACGGWSRRRTLYGGDQRPVGGEAEAAGALDPAVDAARIRAFFVAGTHARRGIGARMLEACETAASAAGFTRFELMSTLPGVPFYTRLGFAAIEPVTDTLPDGTTIEFVRMTRAVRG